MKKIVTDAQSNAYLFDGTKMEAMGKLEAFRDVYNGIIFAIGKDLYLKKGENYTLFAQNAELFTFAEPCYPFEKQFELIGDILLMTSPDKPGFLKLNKEYAKVFLPKDTDGKPLFALKMKDHNWRIFVSDGENGFEPSKTECIGSDGKPFGFWWQGRGYECLNENKLIPVCCHTIYQNNAYLIVCVADFCLRINLAGEIKKLGYDGAIAQTRPENIILTIGNGYWHLGKDDIQFIVAGDNCELKSDGTITYTEVYEDYYGPDIYTTYIYKLKDGKYVKKEEI